jgi:hypothetical protein
MKMDFQEIASTMNKINKAIALLKSLRDFSYIPPPEAPSLDLELNQAQLWREDLSLTLKVRKKYEAYSQYLESYSGTNKDFFETAGNKLYLDFFIKHWDDLPE